MSGVFVLEQSSSVHMIVDSVAYDRDGVITMNNLTKCHAIPTLHMAIAATGPAALSSFIADRLAMDFDSFDHLIMIAETYLSLVFDEFSRHNSSASVYLIGWHARQNEPAAYCFETWTENSASIAQVAANDGKTLADIRGRRGRLVRQDFCGTPMPAPALLQAAGFAVHPQNDQFSPERDLLHLLTIARHEKIEGNFWVGGKAMLTSIDAGGIRQRVLNHWREDQVGSAIAPVPISWERWQNPAVS